MTRGRLWIAGLGCVSVLASGLPAGASAQEPPRLIVLEGDREDQAVAELVIPAGSALEIRSEAGLASVMAGALAAEVETGGDAAVLGWAEPDRLAFRVLAPPDSLPALVGRLLSTLSDPRFDPDGIEREKTRSRAVLQSQLLSPEVVAARALTERVFPDHPYGNLETPRTIADLSREAIVDFHVRWVHPDGGLLVVGGLGTGQIPRAALEAELARWRSSDAGEDRGSVDAARADSGPSPAVGATGVPIHIVDVPGAARASIHVGQALPSIPPRDWAALTTGVELVALENARTFRRWELFQGNLGPIPSVGGVTRQRLSSLLRFQVQVPTDEVDRALQTILETTARAGRTLYTPDRVEAVRDRLLEGVRQDRGTTERVARLAAYFSVGLGTDPDEAFGAWLGTMDAYEVRDAMARWLRVDSMRVVVAGDARTLRPLLENFGPVTVSDASAATVANGERPSPLGEEGGAAGNTEVSVSGDALIPGRWRYRVLIGGTQRGEMVRELRRSNGDGSLTVHTVLEASGLVQDASVRFEPSSLEMIEASLRLSGGVDDFETFLRRDGEGVSGTQRSGSGGVNRSIRGEAPPGVLVGELLELALWQMKLAVGDHVRLPFIDPGTGQGQIADVVVLGESTVAGPMGDEAALVVEVVTGGLRQRLYLRAEGLHIPLASEILGQSLRIEIVAEETLSVGPS